jgi:hypothetical protein
MVAYLEISQSRAINLRSSLPKPCGFSIPKPNGSRLPNNTYALRGIRQGLRPLRTPVHVCQCTGIRVHAIDWRDSRRGRTLQRRDSGRLHLRFGRFGFREAPGLYKYVIKAINLRRLSLNSRKYPRIFASVPLSLRG